MTKCQKKYSRTKNARSKNTPGVKTLQDKKTPGQKTPGQKINMTMINHYYVCNHGLVAEIDGKTYLITDDIIKKYAIRPNFGDGN